MGATAIMPFSHFSDYFMRLVVQGRAITVAHLSHIHRLIGGSTQFMQIAEHAYYLPTNETSIETVRTLCRAAD